MLFGSRRLLNAQYVLQPKGLSDLKGWLGQWREARSRQFFVLGSKDRTASNQTCQATLGADASRCLKLRLPDALALLQRGAKLLSRHQRT